MKIEITAYVARAKPVLLCDSLNAPLLGFSVDSEQPVQQLAFLRATYGDVTYRGNQIVRHELPEVNRIHRDWRDAELYVLEHRRDVPKTGLLKLTAQGSRGNLSIRYAHGIISHIHGSYHGCQTTFSYSLILRGDWSIDPTPEPEH